MQTELDGPNAWEVAIEKKSFTVSFLNEDLSQDRLEFCGNEDLSRMELWRSVHSKYYGKGKLAALTGGLQKFLASGMCEDHKALLGHISEWKQHLDLYGSELEHDTHTLRGLFMDLLPRELKDKLMPKVLKYLTWQSIHMYIKERNEGARELEIARSITAKRPGSGRVYAMNEVTAQQPPDQPITGPSNQKLADMILAMPEGERFW